MPLLFLILLFLAVFVSPALAQEDTPPLDEYYTVNEGLLLPDGTMTIPDATTTPAPVADDTAAMTIDDLTAAYRRGEFRLVAQHIFSLAENGSLQAAELLGIMYRSGQGVPKDDSKALEWLTKAASADLPLAQHHLGVIYFTGAGVPADPARGLMWIRLATIHYPDGSDKVRAQQDYANASSSVTRRDRDRAMVMAREWLDKKGEGHFLDDQAEK